MSKEFYKVARPNGLVFTHISSHRDEMILAQHFSAGKECRSVTSPVGTTEIPVFLPSLRDSGCRASHFPALKCWAKLELSLWDKSSSKDVGKDKPNGPGAEGTRSHSFIIANSMMSRFRHGLLFYATQPNHLH